MSYAMSKTSYRSEILHRGSSSIVRTTFEDARTCSRNWIRSSINTKTWRILLQALVVHREDFGNDSSLSLKT